MPQKRRNKNERMDLRRSHAAGGNNSNDGTVESRDADCNGWCACVISCDAIRVVVVVLCGQKIFGNCTCHNKGVVRDNIINKTNEWLGRDNKTRTTATTKVLQNCQERRDDVRCCWVVVGGCSVVTTVVDGRVTYLLTMYGEEWRV